MFVTISAMKSAVPTTHIKNVNEVEKWLKDKGIDTSKPFPTVFVAGSQSESNFDWVDNRVSKADPAPEQEQALKSAIETVSSSKAGKLYGKTSRVTASKIKEALTKAEIGKVADEYSKLVKGGATATASKSAAPTKTEDKTSTDSNSNSALIDPTDRSALMLALMNFTGKPVDEVESFLVPKEENKIDNSATTSDSSAPAATSADEAPKPVPTTDQNQTEAQTEKSEIPAAASTHPGTDKVDNSGAGRDDSSAVTNDAAPSSTSDTSSSTSDSGSSSGSGE